MWIASLSRGALSGLATAVAYIVPSFVAVLAIAFLYEPTRGSRVQALF